MSTYCPGPGIVSAAVTQDYAPLAFAGAATYGMAAFKMQDLARAKTPAQLPKLGLLTALLALTVGTSALIMSSSKASHQWNKEVVEQPIAWPESPPPQSPF